MNNDTQKFDEINKSGNKWLCVVDGITLGLYDDQIDAIIVHDIAVCFLDGNDKRKKLDRAYDINSDKIPNVYRELLYAYIDELCDKKKDEVDRMEKIKRIKRNIRQPQDLLSFD